MPYCYTVDLKQHMGIAWTTSHGLWHACKVHAWTYKHTHTNTHPHTVVLLADRWCMLKEIQAYPAQTVPAGLALQQRAIGVLMQKLALFRPCNIHLKGQRAQILFTPRRHQYPHFYSVRQHSWANNSDWPGKTVRIWIKHLMTNSSYTQTCVFTHRHGRELQHKHF